MSFISIVFVVTVPIMSLLNSIGRGEGLNEFGHLLSQLQQGAIWSLCSCGLFIFIGLAVLWIFYSPLMQAT